MFNFKLSREQELYNNKIKLNRYITHYKKLSEANELINYCIRQGIIESDELTELSEDELIEYADALRAEGDMQASDDELQSHELQS